MIQLAINARPETIINNSCAICITVGKNKAPMALYFKVKLKNIYTEFVKTHDSNEFKNYLNILSDVRYASWEKSVKASLVE